MNAVLLNPIVFFKSMLVRSCSAVSFAVASIPIDPLYCIVSVTVATWLIQSKSAITGYAAIAWRNERELPRLLLILYYTSRLARSKKVVGIGRLSSRTAIGIIRRRRPCPRKILGNFNLHITKIPFPRLTFTFFLVRIV